MVRIGLAVVAAFYFFCVYFDAAGFQLAPPVPRPFLYFSQIAALFPHAAQASIDWRVELYFCDKKQYLEVDPTPFFPGHEGDKENRFQRALFFFHDKKHDPEAGRVMRALERYLVARWNDAHPDERVGGAHFFSLRLPLPLPGEKFPRYQRRPANEIPFDEHHTFYIEVAQAEAACAKP